MKIGLPSNGETLAHPFAPNFGRCSFFVIYDSDTKQIENVYLNAAQGAAGGAGIQASQSLVDNQVEVVIAPQMGPNAWNVLQSTGIKVYTGIGGTLQQNIDAFLTGQLSEMSEARGFGLGRGRGRGLGRGGGRGRGVGP